MCTHLSNENTQIYLQNTLHTKRKEHLTMIDTTKNMNEYRIKIRQFLSEKGWTQQALVRLTGYPKQDVSAIRLGKQKGTPYANIFISAVCEAYKIN